MALNATVPSDAARVALVTGASSGIGEATVRALLAAGYAVFAGARRVERMAALAAAGAVVLELDVTDDGSMVRAIEAIRLAHGRLDVLVNNAGYGSYGAVEDVPLDEARRQFEVNVFGLARLIQLATPMMRAARSGTIFNISSIGGKMWEPLGAWYHATKFAVEGLSDCLRMELAPFGIAVVVIEPGAIATEWSAIARERLVAVSGAGAYAAHAAEHAAFLAGTDRGGSPPTVVADAIVAALRAKRPKTRYAVGEGAALILTVRRLLGDRNFDRVMRLIERRFAARARRASGRPPRPAGAGS